MIPQADVDVHFTSDTAQREGARGCVGARAACWGGRVAASPPQPRSAAVEGRGRVLVIVVVEATAINLGGVSSVIQAGGLSGGNGGWGQRDQQVESRTHAFGQGDGGQFQGIH